MNDKKAYRYQVVDVFTQAPLEGNPLAVFPDAANLDAPTMQRIARELSLSETVFIVPSQRSDCVARLRIFTPRKEMDFAGHPTIGTAFLLMRWDTCAPERILLGQENVGDPVRSRPTGRPSLWLRCRRCTTVPQSTDPRRPR
jgi:trans-2,3-dihydro-3-hydroxyanthranilate isomerase